MHGTKRRWPGRPEPRGSIRNAQGTTQGMARLHMAVGDSNQTLGKGVVAHQDAREGLEKVSSFGVIFKVAFGDVPLVESAWDSFSDQQCCRVVHGVGTGTAQRGLGQKTVEVWCALCTCGWVMGHSRSW